MPRSTCRERLFFGSNYVHYYTSLPNTSSGSSTTDLFMVLHSLASNAGAYFHDITSVVQAAGACNTAVLAPELDTKGNGCGSGHISKLCITMAVWLSQPCNKALGRLNALTHECEDQPSFAARAGAKRPQPHAAFR